MPLVRLNVRSEESLVSANLYQEPNQDDPAALLEATNLAAGLIGIVRQLGELTKYASNVFGSLHDELSASSARGQALSARIHRLEAEMPAIEGGYLAEKNPLQYAHTTGAQWTAAVRSDQNHFSRNDMPEFMLSLYRECRQPPDLSALDRFEADGDCQKRYTDPSFFRREWANMELAKAEKDIREKQARREKRKGRRRRNTAEDLLSLAEGIVEKVPPLNGEPATQSPAPPEELSAAPILPKEGEGAEGALANGVEQITPRPLPPGDWTVPSPSDSLDERWDGTTEIGSDLEADSPEEEDRAASFFKAKAQPYVHPLKSKKKSGAAAVKSRYAAKGALVPPTEAPSDWDLRRQIANSFAPFDPMETPTTPTPSQQFFSTDMPPAVPIGDTPPPPAPPKKQREWEATRAAAELTAGGEVHPKVNGVNGGVNGVTDASSPGSLGPWTTRGRSGGGGASTPTKSATATTPTKRASRSLDRLLSSAAVAAETKDSATSPTPFSGELTTRSMRRNASSSDLPERRESGPNHRTTPSPLSERRGGTPTRRTSSSPFSERRGTSSSPFSERREREHHQKGVSSPLPEKREREHYQKGVSSPLFEKREGGTPTRRGGVSSPLSEKRASTPKYEIVPASMAALLMYPATPVDKHAVPDSVIAHALPVSRRFKSRSGSGSSSGGSRDGFGRAYSPAQPQDEEARAQVPRPDEPEPAPVPVPMPSTVHAESATAPEPDSGKSEQAEVAVVMVGKVVDGGEEVGEESWEKKPAAVRAARRMKSMEGSGYDAMSNGGTWGGNEVGTGGSPMSPMSPGFNNFDSPLRSPVTSRQPTQLMRLSLMSPSAFASPLVTLDSHHNNSHHHHLRTPSAPTSLAAFSPAQTVGTLPLAPPHIPQPEPDDKRPNPTASSEPPPSLPRAPSLSLLHGQSPGPVPTHLEAPPLRSGGGSPGARGRSVRGGRPLALAVVPPPPPPQPQLPVRETSPIPPPPPPLKAADKTLEKNASLLSAIAAHDRSKLKRVDTTKEPKHSPANEDRNLILEQIRSGVSLRRAKHLEKEIPKVQSSGNINVASILEKANAIRQAFVGSDDEDKEDDDECSDWEY